MFLLPKDNFLILNSPDESGYELFYDKSLVDFTYLTIRPIRGRMFIINENAINI